MEYSAENFSKDLKNYCDESLSDICKYVHALNTGIGKGNINFCKVLLSTGFIKDINYKMVDGTLLHTAVEYNQPELVKILIGNGADLECVTIIGETTLTMAISMLHMEIVKILLDAGANINKIDANGRTPLTCAINSRVIYNVKFLMERGAKFDMKNIHNLRALANALEDGHTEIVKLLGNKCCYGKECLNLAKGICMLEHETQFEAIVETQKYTSDTIKDDLFYEPNFGYNKPISIKNPFNARRLSELITSGEYSENVFFDMPLTEHNLSFVKNAVYVTFDISVNPDTMLFYDYLKQCSNYHIGFSMYKYNLTSSGTKAILFPANIKSLMIANYNPHCKIISDTLEELYLGSDRTIGITTEQLAKYLPITVKILGLDAFMDVPITNPIEVLLLMNVASRSSVCMSRCSKCVNCRICYKSDQDYYTDTVKKIIIVPDGYTFGHIFKYSVPSIYKKLISIHRLNDDEYKIEWV